MGWEYSTTQKNIWDVAQFTNQFERERERERVREREREREREDVCNRQYICSLVCEHRKGVFKR